ncbi:MAG: 50S ribosomal protein L25 [Planctomycetota bacterium]
MQIATLKGETRTPGGRHANERLRRGGMIPAIVYGHGEAPETIAISRHELELALRGHAHVVQVDIGGKATQFFLKEVQYDHLDKTPIHADLMRVDPNERIQVSVPIELRGTPAGLTVGGELIQVISDLEVECKLLEIPESVRVKIDHLNIGQAVYVKELELPADVKAMHDPEEVVVSVRLKRLEAEAPAAAPAEGATAEPEVIGRVAKEKTEGEEK